jgi:hypothetical protein
MIHLARGALAATAAPQVLQPAEGDEWVGIGSDGTDFLVAWRNFDSLGRRMVVGQRVAGDGHLLDDQPFRIGQSNSGQRVTAVWDGAQYLVFAVNTRGGNPFELRTRRVGPAGEPLDDDWIPVTYLAQPWAGTGNGSDAVMLAPGRTFLVYDRYYDEDATGNVRVRGRFIDSTPRAAVVDAGVAVDAGLDVGGSDVAADAAAAGAPSSSGCSCRVGGGAAGMPAPILLLLCLLSGAKARRRRRSRPAGPEPRAPARG